MKKILILSLLLAAFAACKKDDLPSGTPECIKDKVKEFSKLEGPRKVQLAIVNGEDQYWFNDGATAFDGAEYIYDAACEQTCFFCGFCIPPACTADYDNVEWTVIWEQ